MPKMSIQSLKIPRVSELLNFRNKVAIVTGAGSGIGVAIARRFAEAGASVVIGYKTSQGGAKELVEEIRANDGKSLALAGDMTDRTSVERLANAAMSAYGKLDVWVNNAGIYPVSPILEMTDEEWDQVMAANLRSVQLGTQIAARKMIEGKLPGSIVNIASIEAENPAPGHAHYDAAKAGVVMHTRTAALELGELGIRVNAVSPGLIWKEGLDAAWPEGVSAYKAAVPLGRLGRAEDVADACLFLASDAARWITGTNLLVDGGVLTNRSY